MGGDICVAQQGGLEEEEDNLPYGHTCAKWEISSPPLCPTPNLFACVLLFLIINNLSKQLKLLEASSILSFHQ